MNNNMILYMMIGAGALFFIVIIAYMIIMKKQNKAEVKHIQQLREGTKAKTFSMEVIYQKLYIFYLRTPFLRRYLLKIRRRLEIINLDDEYITRTQSSKILTRTLLTLVPIIIAIFALTGGNTLLRVILLIFTVFMVDTFIDGRVDKIDSELLKQQINFFSEIRHAYHEYNMVEEAIYQVAQDDDAPEMSRQAEKIYEILLEKYYDIAPNSYLKEFAGISYLTKEFGDRQVDGGSLYLKNLNNITQELQLELLKRDKLNYVFQSLSVIALVPMLCLEPIKNWAISQFSFTESFYNGKNGMIVQVLILVATFVCYLLTRKLKDNGAVATNIKNTENPWQAKLYKIPFVKKFVDLFIPKKGTKDYRKVRDLLKDSASKQKMEWIYINRICIAVVAFVASLVLFYQFHQVSIHYVYTEPTTDYNIMGQMDEKDAKKAMETTEQDNYFLNKFRGKQDTTLEQIVYEMERSPYYKDATEEEIATAAERVMGKLQTINTEYMQWFEVLLSMVFAVVGYMSPILLLKFQLKMRQMEMENEVMQFQTIIMMLMKIERVNVEIILEWLERYANIFKEPISKCVNNYESGPWEALEAMKEDVSYQELIRIIESLQAAVEKIPIKDAFDELDSERAYYQEKRKESNDRLISRKGMLGKAIGFAPMIILFVGYLIIPLVFIGILTMSESMNAMTAMQ